MSARANWAVEDILIRVPFDKGDKRLCLFKERILSIPNQYFSCSLGRLKYAFAPLERWENHLAAFHFFFQGYRFIDLCKWTFSREKDGFSAIK